MYSLGIIDLRSRYRLTAHLIVAGSLFVVNFFLLIVAEYFTEGIIASVGTFLFFILVGTVVAGYSINLVDDHCTKVRPIHCKRCRTALPMKAQWVCGCCEHGNPGPPLGQCEECESAPHAIVCPNPDCGHTILLRAPLGNEPLARFHAAELEHDHHEEILDEHRRKQ